MAISQALKVNLKIAYLDGRNQDGRVEFVTFNHASDQNETPLTLLYRCVMNVSFLLVWVFPTPCCVMLVGPDTTIYWIDVAASHRRSKPRAAEQEEDICGYLYVYYVVDRARDMRVNGRRNRAALSVSDTRGLKKYKNYTSVPWDRTTNS